MATGYRAADEVLHTLSAKTNLLSPALDDHFAAETPQLACLNLPGEVYHVLPQIMLDWIVTELPRAKRVEICLLRKRPHDVDVKPS